LFSYALVVRAGACFVFGFNEHLLAWVADAIVASFFWLSFSYLQGRGFSVPVCDLWVLRLRRHGDCV
jgi:hypothetical protein